jgi:hypothetical protein
MAGPTLSIGPLESFAPTADFAELGSFGRVHFAWSRENVGRAKALVAASSATISRGLYVISEPMWSVKIVHKFIAFLGLLVDWLRFAKSAEISAVVVREVLPHCQLRPAHSRLRCTQMASFGRYTIAANVTVFARKSRSSYLKVCVAKHLPASSARRSLYTIVLARTTVA